MPKFLADFHYNEEEISRNLKTINRILAGPNEWQHVCNRSNPEKTGRSCEGADFSWLSSKVSQTLTKIMSEKISFWPVISTPPSMNCLLHASPTICKKRNRKKRKSNIVTITYTS
jgi:hypothetical protein